MSLLDDTASDLPVKDTGGRPAVLRAIEDVMSVTCLPKTLIQASPKMKVKDLKTRSRVSVISREELEDSFLHLHEENLLLKGYARKQEDKIKRMATKLLRLTSDFGPHGEKKSKKDGRDLEAEETTDNLQERVRDLERRNEALKQRLTTYKQRIQLQNGCRHCPYSAIAARIDSSMRKNTKLPEKYRKGLRVQGTDIDPPRVTADCYGESLSDEAKADTDRLFQIISRNCNMDEVAAVLLKHMVASKPKDSGPDIMLSLQHLQQAEEQRTIIQENVMNIRLQKELRDKNMSLSALKEQFQQLKESYEAELEEKQKALTLSHQAVLTQLETLSEQLKDERCKVIALEVEQKNMSNLQRSLSEHQDQISDLEKEKQLLKEDYENLLKRSLDSDRVNTWKVREEELRAQISKLEQQVQQHQFDLTFSKEQLQFEREQINHLRQDISKLQGQLLEKMQELKILQEKLSSVSYSSDCVKEASSKPEVNQLQASIQEERIFNQKDFWNGNRESKRLMCLEDSSPKQEREAEKNRGGPGGGTAMEVVDAQRTQLEQDTKRRMLELDASHAETILELEKIRELLMLQQQINKDYQDELKSVKLRAECDIREKEERECHYEAKLLKRNSRIQMLEAQLKDIAYGTLPYRLKSEDASSPECSASPPPSLQRGETLFEIHIGSICFSSHGIGVVDDPQPVTFCVYSFYDFETHATPVVTGIRPQYNFTSCYAVTPDPEFLSYLRVGTMTVELYQVIGAEHCELARGRLRLETALQTTDRLHSTILLTDALGENIGEMDYWLRLHGPLYRSQCLQRQRSKAKVYLSTPRYNGPEKLWASQLTHENQNALIIKICGCRSLRAATMGQQPSPYVVYRFYTHPDHSSSIIPCSNNPQFSDEAVYPVNLSTDLDHYLIQQCLYVYVFDDEEVQPASYLGKAEVPLHSLAQGNRIQGDYALISPTGKCAGSAQLSLEWKFPYAPGKNLWNSVPDGHPVLKKAQDPYLKQRSNGKQLSIGAPRAHISKLKPSKSRKAETALQRDVHSSKRGRRDGNIDVHEQERRQGGSPWGQHIEETDMAVEDIEEEEQLTNAMVDEELCELDHNQASMENDKNYFSESQSQTHDGSSDDADDDDDDEIIVAKPLLPYQLPSSKIRVEIASLTLDPCSEVVADESVERVFVEFQFPGVPPEETETPLSLRKPSRGEEIYYHFSKVIHLDGKEHSDRRHFLYMLLEGSDSEGERVRLKFTVVSDPVNEKDEDCHDVGYAYLDLRHLLRRSVDPAEETLQITDALDPREIIGSLRVMIEAREAARAIYKEKRTRATRSSPAIIIN